MDTVIVKRVSVTIGGSGDTITVFLDMPNKWRILPNFSMHVPKDTGVETALELFPNSEITQIVSAASQQPNISIIQSDK